MHIYGSSWCILDKEKTHGKYHRSVRGLIVKYVDVYLSQTMEGI